MANNLPLLAEKTGVNLDDAMFLYPLENVGDGLEMVTAAGARETPISFMNVNSVKGYVPTDAISVGSGLQPVGLFVNGNGERFMPEDLYIKKFFALVTNAWESQNDVFCLVDAKTIDLVENQGIICGVAATKAGDKLPDFRAQLEEASAAGTGAAFKGETIEELAEAMGIDAETLKNTVEVYNAACEAGVDEEFGKDPKYLVSFEEGPFYAVRPILCIFATMGGIDIDRGMHVLNMQGEPIKGLFSSGSASCALYKETYCYQVSGGMNAYCCYSGREAARQALAE